MEFMDALKNTIDQNSFAKTANGALGYSTSGKNLLDLNFSVTALRKKSDEQVQNAFAKAYYENKLYAIKWLFYARDAREGVGERRLFRVCMKWLVENDFKITKAVLNLIPEYGRWDDLVDLLNGCAHYEVVDIIKKQLNEDIENEKNGKPISLLAKWLPSENATSWYTKTLAKTMYTELGITPREYRKMLSTLRKHLDVVERKMAAKEWNDIDYNKVPSKANLIYNNAFLRNDRERRNEYLESLAKGDTNVKINASVLFPDEIVHKYNTGGWGWSSARVKNYDETLERLWKALPNLVTENTLVVRDGSGSMTCDAGKPMEVSTALAIYMAERMNGQFKNKFITFSAYPRIVDLNNLESLHDKLEKTYVETECSNTNIEKVFKLILSTAVRNNMSQDDMPKNIVIISDMQFDKHSFNCKDTLFDAMSQEYAQHGYKLPRLIFWNVRTSHGNNVIPIQQNEMGVVLMSGYSQNLVKMVMSNQTDPYLCLIEQLDSKRYLPVETAIKNLLNIE